MTIGQTAYLLLFQLRKFWPARITFLITFLQNATILPLRQRQALMPTTGQSILAHCSRRGIPHKAVVIATPRQNGSVPTPDATLHYLTCAGGVKQRVLLFVHGGGYAVSISKPGSPFA
jgi:hypothetical protein